MVEVHLRRIRICFKGKNCGVFRPGRKEVLISLEQKNADVQASQFIGMHT